MVHWPDANSCINVAKSFSFVFRLPNCDNGVSGPKDGEQQPQRAITALAQVIEIPPFVVAADWLTTTVAFLGSRWHPATLDIESWRGRQPDGAAHPTEKEEEPQYLSPGHHNSCSGSSWTRVARRLSPRLFSYLANSDRGMRKQLTKQRHQAAAVAGDVGTGTCSNAFTNRFAEG